MQLTNHRCINQNFANIIKEENMSELECEFSFHLDKIKNNVPNATKDCMDVLRKMYSTPSYKLGEMQPILNRNINRYCKESGESYESVLMKMSMTKLND